MIVRVYPFEETYDASYVEFCIMNENARIRVTPDGDGVWVGLKTPTDETVFEIKAK
jgi:hypothetical protein